MVTNDERRRIAARLREGDFTERCDTVQQLADMLAPIFGTEDMNPNETAERLADLIDPGPCGATMRSTRPRKEHPCCVAASAGPTTLA